MPPEEPASPEPKVSALPIGPAPAPEPKLAPDAPQDSIAGEDSFILDDSFVPLDGDAIGERIKTFLIGKPRDLADQSVFQHVSLVAFLAWVGLGADGLSSTSYGPMEAFHNLHGQTYLAIFLALATIITVFVISACYSHIIEEFPSGGGGYLVASKLLGRQIGVVSGCALLVDYVLTITVSVAAAGDALFGLVDPKWQTFKLSCEFAAIILLIVLNLRGIRESITALLPVFLLFLLTHAILIFGSVALHIPQAGDTLREIGDGVRGGLADPKLGLFGMLALFLHAYSMGAGTYTGLEAVSNSMPVMREPRVATAKRTMRYMAWSLAITAGGLMLAYLLLRLRGPEGQKTMNFVLTERFVAETLGEHWYGSVFLWTTIVSEGLLLIVAAQAGFIDGPRVLANLAQDSWAPHWFANLSERLATHNGILLLGLAALSALWYTGGNVLTLVIMYSINVFVTFSLSMIGMLRHWYQLRGKHPLWRRRLALFLLGTVFCVSILCVTVYVKFFEGGWKTLVVTGLLIFVCYLIHGYYLSVVARLQQLDATLGKITPPDRPPNNSAPDPRLPTAAVLVGGYSGLGVHTLLNVVRFAPNYFKNMIFISVGTVDSGNFKGAGAVDELQRFTERSLGEYVDLARKLGMPSTSFMSLGTDAVEELERVCLAVRKAFPQTTFFAGQLVFRKETWYQRLLHNQTAYALQRRLNWDGIPMVILPTRVR